MKKRTKAKKAKFTCRQCGLQVDKISPWKHNECPGYTQHSFKPTK